MDFQSVKTRFMGSYIFLLALFILQVPIIYYLIGGMSEKYSQVEEAGSLRKRAVELTEILNRHILSGDGSLEREFVSKRQEYSKVIEDLKKGTKEFGAIKDAEELDRLGAVEREWGGMQPVLDKALSAGDRLRRAKSEVEGSTFPMIETLSRLADSTGGKASNAAALDRMRTVKLSYLLERYLVSFSDRDIVSTDLKTAIAEFDESIGELKGTGSAYAKDAERLWRERKDSVLEGIAANDGYYHELHALVDVHTPRIVAAANELTREITRQARNSALKGIGIMVLSVIISACFAGFFMWLANNHLVKPIVKEAVEGLAKGDLTRRAGVKVRFFGREFNDEVASLGESLDTMAEQMSGVIGNIADSSHRLASASGQLSASSARIYEGVDTQSKETAQAATAMEEMNATVVEVAKNSQEATETAQKTRDIAQKGGLVVSEAITAMTEVAEATAGTAEKIKKLGKSSEEIGTIISAITDIADQTNLLALNAAIEAARAGDHGRGFAVVADEVMKLADRTAKATKEISQMINSIQEETAKAVDAMSEGTVKVENGVKLANEAGQALQEIVEGVENVTNMIGQIATSAGQQSAATDEITRNMDAVSEASRSNVASVNEVAGAADELNRLAEELTELVSNFDMQEDPSDPGLRLIADKAKNETEQVKEMFPRLVVKNG